MVLYPDIQKKAQDEIDRFVGSSRLPDYSDMDSLPYTEAVVRELLRWNPVIPLGACGVGFGGLLSFQLNTMH